MTTISAMTTRKFEGMVLELELLARFIPCGRKRKGTEQVEGQKEKKVQQVD